VAKVSAVSKKKVAATKSTRRALSRLISVREEIRATGKACDTAARQIRDELVLREIERALEAMSLTVENCGSLWLAGNGPGFCLAVDVCHKLSTTTSKYERPTRASVLGLNVATSTTSYGKCGTDESLGAELMVQGRRGDALWCFASDPGSRALLGVATRASKELKIPVIVFTHYPGTPLVRFASTKVRIQQADERDPAGYCVEWAHSFLANIMCNQLKRIARRTR
jgi:phosphoheptose isomerase